MKPLIRILFFALLTVTVSNLMGQKLLVLEKAGTVKNFKYKIGDKIGLITVRDNLAFSGEITDIKDSSIVIAYYNEIRLGEVSAVLRKSEFLRFFSNAAIIAGVFYFSLDAFNGLINNDSPVIAQNTLIASGALVGTGYLMKQFVTHKYDLNNKWRLKILDFNFPGD